MRRLVGWPGGVALAARLASLWPAPVEYLIGVAGDALRAPMAELSRSYGSPFVLHGLDLLHGSLVLLGTLLLGWLGAWLVTGHFLRQIIGVHNATVRTTTTTRLCIGPPAGYRSATT